MTIARKLTANMIYAVGGRIAGAAFGLTTTAIMARHLGPEVFGVFRAASGWAILSCMFANLGLDVVCLREISRPNADAKRVIGTALGMRMLVGAACVVLSAAVVWVVPQSQGMDPVQLSQATAIAALGGVATLGNDIVGTIFQQSLTQKRASAAELVGGAATLGFTGVAVFFHGGLLAFTLAASGGLVATALVSIALAESLTPVRPRFDLKLGRRMAVSGLPVFGAEMLGALAARLDTVLLSLLSVAAQVGYYGVANRIREIAVRLPWLFAALMMPVLTRLADRPDEFRRHVSDALLVAWVFAIAIVVGLGCFADTIVLLLAGSDYLVASRTVMITGPTLAAGSMAAILQYAAYALDRGTETLKVKAVSSVVGLLGMLYFIPKAGSLGAAVGILAGELVFMVGLIRHASPDGTGVMPWDRMGLATLAGGGCAATAILMTRVLGWPWYAGLMAIVIAYPALLLAMRVVTLEQVRSLTAGRREAESA